MISEATTYLSLKCIKRREPLYSANRVASVIGDIPIASLQSEDLERIRTSLLERSLSSRTIESTIADILTVHRHFTGHVLPPGRRLAQTPLHPVGVDHRVVDLLWPECHAWVRSWIALTMWTGLRLSDSMRALLRYRLQQWPETLSVIASKTGKHHAIPLPIWLRVILAAGPYRFRAVSDFSRRALRKELFTACRAAHVPELHPKYFRQEGITQWTIANASAGAVIHGSGLKILGHYVVQSALLERVSPAVTMPSCFGAATTSPEHLIETFTRLDPQAQELILRTAERLAAQ